MDGKLVLHQVDNENWRIDLINMIDEQIKFPVQIPPDLKKITIDFGEVSYINSMGLNQWIRWIKSIERQNPKLVFEFNRWTTSFLRASEVTADVIPGKATVTSLFCDYFCSSCGSFKRVLTENSRSLAPRKEKCQTCGAEMELELMPETYMSIARFAPNK